MASASEKIEGSASACRSLGLPEPKVGAPEVWSTGSQHETKVVHSEDAAGHAAPRLGLFPAENK